MKPLTNDQEKTLRAILPRDAVITNPTELLTYEMDGSLGLGQPHALVLPRTTDQVVSIVGWANQQDFPIIPRGAGTGLSGGALASHGGIVISFARMKDVLELDQAGRSAVIQPGIVHQSFDEFVRTKGLYYPPDPASGRACTLGGNLGENAGGPHCFKYGVTTNYILGLKVVLGDGHVVVTGGRAFDYPEYDLTGLLIGAEGTLGIVTEAYTRLIRNIPGVKTLMAMFDSVEQAGEAVSSVIAHGLVPGTLEMMDRNMIGIVENYVHAGLPTDANALLIIEADGYPESLDSQMNEMMRVLQECQATKMRLAKDAAERDQIWFARKSAFGAIAQISPAYLIVDGTVPRSKLGPTLAQINQICSTLDLRVGYVFHAGDGNLHPLILFDPQNSDMVRRVHLAGQAVMELCVKQGGTITGEHGVGSEKVKYMSLMFNRDELAAFQDIKDAFDPKHILNPGKIIPKEELIVPPSQSSARREITDEIAPASPQEASDLMRGWNSLRPIPQVRILGGGTKSKTFATSREPRRETPHAIILSTRALKGIKAYARDDLYVTVGAGPTLTELETELARDQIWVPLVSPWRESTLGGIAATNFNAPLRMRYGALRDLILAMTTVLPDGRIIRAGRPVVKNVAGYDLAKLFTGSYGTLGLITDITFKLLPFPRARATMVIPVEDQARGVKVGMELLRVCLVASSLLLCKGLDVPGSTAPYSIIYTAEGVPEDVNAEFSQVRQVVEDARLTAITNSDLLSGNDIWASWIHASSKDGTMMRVGIAPKDAPTVLEKLQPALADGRFIVDFATGLIYAHNAPVDQVRQAAQQAKGYAVVLSGSSSTVSAWGNKPDALDLMKSLKNRWDINGMLNADTFIV